MGKERLGDFSVICLAPFGGVWERARTRSIRGVEKGWERGASRLSRLSGRCGQGRNTGLLETRSGVGHSSSGRRGMRGIQVR